MPKSCTRALVSGIRDSRRCRGIFSQNLVELTAQRHGQQNSYKFRHVWICNQTDYSTNVQQTHRLGRILTAKFPWQTRHEHALVGYHPPRKPLKSWMGYQLFFFVMLQREMIFFRTSPSHPPSADVRLLRDLKEQATVLQKDILSTGPTCRGSGRGMVMKDAYKNQCVGLRCFSLQFPAAVSDDSWLRKPMDWHGISPSFSFWRSWSEVIEWHLPWQKARHLEKKTVACWSGYNWQNLVGGGFKYFTFRP